MRDAILVTGGAGFIGSNFILSWIVSMGSPVVNLDLLTYAGNPANLSSLENDPRYLLVRGDICDAELVGSLLREHRPRAIVHFAAESHVDRSIASPGAFIRTNVQGTFVLLEQGKAYWSGLSEADRMRIPVPAHLHRRSLRLAGGAGSCILRDYSLRSEQSLCGIEGSFRPPGKGVFPHLGPSGAYHKLLQ
jgi:hypothetical protein